MVSSLPKHSCMMTLIMSDEDVHYGCLIAASTLNQFYLIHESAFVQLAQTIV